MTAITIIRTAIKIDMKPATVKKDSFWNLRTEAAAATRIADTRENQTVQAPWEEKVFRAMDTPRILQTNGQKG